jgi:hypothetical protein
VYLHVKKGVRGLENTRTWGIISVSPSRHDNNDRGFLDAGELGVFLWGEASVNDDWCANDAEDDGDHGKKEQRR